MSCRPDPPIRVGTLPAYLEPYFPETRISCDDCARTTGQRRQPGEVVCPRLPKVAGELKHRCWYFLPQRHVEDQRPGHERFATDDMEQRRYFGFKENV